MLTKPKQKVKLPFYSARRIFAGTDHRSGFRHRGEEITRVEALSDAVFAFSISLLIVALEVPQTFTELKLILLSFVPFMATVSLVLMFWYQQYRFFRHYGLNDVPVIVQNAAMLIMILFYIYPLKFLFSLLFAMIVPGDFFPKATARGEVVITQAEFPQLVLVYSVGYAAIWLVFYLLYRRAWKARHALTLTAYEQVDTLKEIWGSGINVAIGVAAAILAWAGYAGAGGICFLLIAPLLLFNDWRFRKRMRKTAALHH